MCSSDLNDITKSKSCYFRYLSPSNIIKQKIREIQKARNLYSGRITDTKLYEIYKVAGTSVFEISLIMSSMRPRRRDRQRFINRAKDYLKINKSHIIDGNEIQRILNIQEGAQIGRILENINEGQFKGFFKNASQARKWIISNFT